MKQKIVPIVFALDRNLLDPARVCLTSLMVNANKQTYYDIYILHPAKEQCCILDIDALYKEYTNFNVTYIQVGGDFDGAYEIRGITSPAYYRLFIPELIPQYDKVVYSDVDVIFRDDLSNIYYTTDLTEYYIAGVDSLAHLIPDLRKYYENERKVEPSGNIYSGNIIINSKKMLEDGVLEEFRKHMDKKYMFQDMDIINIVCKGKIKYLPPSFCYTTYISDFAVNNMAQLKTMWTEEQITEAQNKGIVHYNGLKPWQGVCINFDIWWQYYRASPFYDPKYYFDFFSSQLNQLDGLTLLKRIKLLLRFFFK